MSTNGNGKTEWIWRACMVIMTALVAYFTAIGAVQKDIAVVSERENLHFQEILRRLERMERKIDGLP